MQNIPHRNMADDAQSVELRQRAQAAAGAGRHDEAEQLWRQILTRTPEQPEGLHFMGQQAMRRGDVRAAFDLLTRAARGAPEDVMLQLNLARTAQALGNDAAEMAALNAALAADFGCFPAMLAKAELLERQGEPRAAAQLSRVAVKILPPDEKLLPRLQEMARSARRRVAEDAALLEDFLRERLGAREVSAKHFEEVLGIVSGRKKAFVHQPTFLHFPALPAISFYDNADFPWLDEVEAATDRITDELRALLENRQDFRPYIALPAGSTQPEWAELNHSPKWSAYFFWQDGKRMDENCARCPQTVALLESLPLSRVPGMAPEPVFSVLQPRAHIPSHTGATNARAVVHLPLIVPDGCRFRVGNDIRTVRRGKAWVFDDTIEHEAWNDSDQSRIILIFDVWNPALSAEQRAMIAGLVSGEAEYYGRKIAD